MIWIGYVNKQYYYSVFLVSDMKLFRHIQYFLTLMRSQFFLHATEIILPDRIHAIGGICYIVIANF